MMIVPRRCGKSGGVRCTCDSSPPALIYRNSGHGIFNSWHCDTTTTLHRATAELISHTDHVTSALIDNYGSCCTLLICFLDSFPVVGLVRHGEMTCRTRIRLDSTHEPMKLRQPWVNFQISPALLYGMLRHHMRVHCCESHLGSRWDLIPLLEEVFNFQ